VTAGTGAPVLLKRALRPLRTRAGEVPFLLPALLRLTTASIENPRITADTRLVIEGFPRSGNSFASTAFGIASGYALSRSSNTHLAGQVKVAVARGVPTLVLIRPAVDAAASLCVAASYLTPAGALREWLRFYRAIQPLQDGYVLATFDEVTGDFGAVIDRVNERYAVDLPRFEHTEDNVRRVQQSLDEWDVTKRGFVLEESVARPSSARAQATATVRAAMQQPQCRALVDAATDLYGRMLAARTS
jgi:hypothetical protein